MNSSNQVIPFRFNNITDVRTLLIDDQPWFVASDIAKALDYRDAANLSRVLDDDERGTHIVSTPSGDQQMLVINESGLYHAIIKSRKPSAQAFRKWITAEVIPEIRKSGKYEAAPKASAAAPILSANGRSVCVREANGQHWVAVADIHRAAGLHGGGSLYRNTYNLQARYPDHVGKIRFSDARRKLISVSLPGLVHIGKISGDDTVRSLGEQAGAYLGAGSTLPAVVRPQQAALPFKPSATRGRKDLLMYKHCEAGLLTDNWHEAFAVGEAWFADIEDLAKTNPREAFNAIRFMPETIKQISGANSGYTYGLLERMALSIVRTANPDAKIDSGFCMGLSADEIMKTIR